MKKGLSVKILPVLLLLSILLIPLAAAQIMGEEYIGFYISYLVQTYLFRFLLIFLGLFAILYFSLNNFLFRGNSTLSAVAGAATSLLITPTVVKYYEDYVAFGDYSQMWIIILAVIIFSFLLLILKNWKNFGGAFGAVFKSVFRMKTILGIYLFIYVLVMVILPYSFRMSLAESTKNYMTVGAIVAVIWLIILVYISKKASEKAQKQR